MTHNKQTISIDPDLHRRLTTGDSYTRSMVTLYEMVRLLQQIIIDMVDSIGITGSDRRGMIEESRRRAVAELKRNPPPGIDPKALTDFCA